MPAMTSRERFLTAMRNGVPDRVPCAPDFSNMIPCKLTGRPFWDVYYHGSPPLWRAYLEAARYYGIDAWFVDYDGPMRCSYPVPLQHDRFVRHRSAERMVVAERIRTPAGDLEAETTYYLADPPTRTVKPVKDLKRDWPKVCCLFQVPDACDPYQVEYQKRELGESGVYGRDGHRRGARFHSHGWIRGDHAAVTGHRATPDAAHSANGHAHGQGGGRSDDGA